MNSKTLGILRRGHVLLLLLILGLAAGLRLFSLSGLGFWTDEFCTLSCSHGWGLEFDKVPATGIVASRPVMTRLSAALGASHIIPGLVRDEAHPPLYFLLLRAWENLWGDSESAVRSLNVVFSLLSIVLLFRVATESVGATAALWACLLMAVAEPQIQFAQEARNYVPVTTFSLLAIWAVQRLKRRPDWLCSAVLVIALLAMMLTHYFAAGVAVGLAIYAITFLRGRARWLASASFVVAGLVFLLLWGPSLWRQWPHFSGNYAWVSDTAAGHTGRVTINLLRLLWRLVAELPKSAPLQIGCETAGAFFFLWLAWAFVRRSELRIWILVFACAVGIIVAVDLFRSTAQLALLRYSLFATPALYVLIAAGISRGKCRSVLPGLCVILAMTSLPSAYVPAWKIDFRTPVQVVGRQLQSADGLVFIGTDPVEVGVMFGAFQHYLSAMPNTVAVVSTPPDAPLRQRLTQCKNVWFICVGTQNFDAPPAFKVREREQIPYFAEVVVGRFEQPAS